MLCELIDTLSSTMSLCRSTREKADKIQGRDLERTNQEVLLDPSAESTPHVFFPGLSTLLDYLNSLI